MKCIPVLRKIVPGCLIAGAFAFSGCGRETPEPAWSAGKQPVAASVADDSAGKYAAFPQTFADVAEAALPSVVSIYTEHERVVTDAYEYFFGDPSGREESGLGSGVIMDDAGHILTNYHVIKGASRIRVQFHDGREFGATVIGTDPPTDLAVIRVTPEGREEARDAARDVAAYPAIPAGDSDKLRVGEWVIAVGSPYGLSHTVTTGIISAKGRHNTGINNYENFLQTDAAINPGNSGGALLNLRGELVGINTAIFSRSGGYQGIGFAIPANMARKVYEDLIRDGEVTRGWLGVSIQPLDPVLAEALGVTARRGALVSGVIEGSPAGKAGLQRGDVITRIDETVIPDPNVLLNHIALLKPGAWVEIEVNRRGKVLDFKARIARRVEAGPVAGQPRGDGEDPLAALRGLGLEALTSATRRDYRIVPDVAGVLVSVVEPGSRGEEAGLREGDVIVEVNRVKVRTPADVQAAVRAAGGKGAKTGLLLLVNRRGDTFFTML